MVRTAGKLRESGASVVLLDLTAFGRNLSAEQWYESLRDRIGRQLHLEDELEAYAGQMAKVSPLQRWMGAITDVGLQRLPGRLVVFLDEIDFAKSLPFSTDELFAAIRACYNRRVLDPEMARITFCLLGVASPSDLIRDSRTTPFNVGRRIELTDFTPTEAAPLTLGLRCDSSAAETVLARVLYWTGGHPYLTQRLCRAAAEAQATSDSAVDRLCEELFLSTRARASDDNLLFAREQMLRGEADRASLLTLYSRIRERKRVPDDPTDQIISILRLSGVVRTVGGRLSVSNRIYQRVFDRRWVESNMPDQERRRQRAAYRRGLLKAGFIAAVIVGAMGGLAGTALLEQHEAKMALKREASQHHIADQLKSVAEEKTRAAELATKEQKTATLLAETRRKAAEAAQEQLTIEKAHSDQLQRVNQQTQAIANSSSHSASLQLAQGLVAHGDAMASAGRWGDAKASYDDAVVAYGRAKVSSYEADLGLCSAYVHAPPPLLVLPAQESAVTSAAISADGRLALSGSASGSVTLWDLPAGTERFAFEGHTAPVRVVAFSPDGRTAYSGSADGTVRSWDITTGAAIRTLTLSKPATPDPAHANPAPLPSFDFSFSTGGDKVASADADGVKLWDAKSGSLIRKITSEHGRVRIAPDGSSIFVMPSGSAPEIWRLTKDGDERLLEDTPARSNRRSLLLRRAAIGNRELR